MHKIIKLLLTASILIHAGANLLAPIYAIFIEGIGGTLLDASIALGIAAIVGGLFAMKFGFDLLFGIMAGFALVSACLSLLIQEKKNGMNLEEQ
ncbi:MAG: hypothetical protein ACI9UR_002348 [Bacteroidia bacterium]|jgi:hypothetical protein